MRVGDTIECPECEAQLEVISIDPVELSVVYEDLEEEEWEEDEDWEEDFDLGDEDLEAESFEDMDDWEEEDEDSDWD